MAGLKVTTYEIIKAEMKSIVFYGGQPGMRSASASSRGWHTKMQDTCNIITALRGDETASFCGVFDGHGVNGEQYSDHVKEYLAGRITKTSEYSRGDLDGAIRVACKLEDEILSRHKVLMKDGGGTTANFIIIKGGHVTCGNVGDSRAVASLKGVAEPLSEDHKASVRKEEMRIVHADCFVNKGRVGLHPGDRGLGLSRAFGDFEFKRCSKTGVGPDQQAVVAVPDIKSLPVTEDLEFIILASDGVWDCISSQAAVDYIREQVAEQVEIKKICENLILRCTPATDPKQRTVGGDNKTVVLVFPKYYPTTNRILAEKQVKVTNEEKLRPVSPQNPVDPDPVDDTGDADDVEAQLGAAGGEKSSSTSVQQPVSEDPPQPEQGEEATHHWSIPWKKGPAGGAGKSGK